MGKGGTATARKRARTLRVLVPVALLVLVAAGGAVRLWLGGDAPLDPLAEGARRDLAAIDRLAAVSEAEGVLATVRAELQEERVSEGLATRVERAADGLEAALAGAGVAGSPWPELEAELDLALDQLQRGDPSSDVTLARLGALLRDYGP